MSGSDLVGCWFYPALSPTARLPVARLTVRVTALIAGVLELTLHKMTAPTGPLVLVGTPYRIATPPVGVSTDVPLPLGWATLLLTGQATGVAATGTDYTPVLANGSGTLTFTPLS